MNPPRDHHLMKTGGGGGFGSVLFDEYSVGKNYGVDKVLIVDAEVIMLN